MIIAPWRGPATRVQRLRIRPGRAPAACSDLFRAEERATAVRIARATLEERAVAAGLTGGPTGEFRAVDLRCVEPVAEFLCSGVVFGEFRRVGDGRTGQRQRRHHAGAENEKTATRCLHDRIRIYGEASRKPLCFVHCRSMALRLPRVLPTTSLYAFLTVPLALEILKANTQTDSMHVAFISSTAAGLPRADSAISVSWQHTDFARIQLTPLAFTRNDPLLCRSYRETYRTREHR